MCQELSYLNEQNIRKNQGNEGTYTSHVTPKEVATVVRLVGKRCIVKCSLNVVTTALWDTGAQVSIVSHEWVLKNLRDAKLHTVETLLGVSELDLKAANDTALPYNGSKSRLWD